MMLVNVERGREEGNALARKLEEIAREVGDDQYDPINGEPESTVRQSSLSQQVQDDLDGSYSYQRS